MKIRIFSILVLGLLLLNDLSGCAPQASAISVETVWGKPSSMAGAEPFS